MIVIVIVTIMLSPIYFGTSVQGRVINKWTGEPVEEAIVVVHSELRGLGHGELIEQINLAETVSNLDGQYKLSWWGPRLGSRFFAGIPKTDPQIIVYKPGYLPFYADNRLVNSSRFDLFHSEQNVELTPFEGGYEDYLPYANALGKNLRFLYWNLNCDWIQVRRLIVAADELNSVYNNLSVHTDIEPLSNLEQRMECDSLNGI